MTRRAAGEVETTLKAMVEGTSAVGGTVEAIETGAHLQLRGCEEITGKSMESARRVLIKAYYTLCREYRNYPSMMTPYGIRPGGWPMAHDMPPGHHQMPHSGSVSILMEI